METQQQPEPTFNPSKGRFNRTAIKKQFKFVSLQTRGGKFTRVSEEAINEAEARVEAKIRELTDRNVTSPIGGSVKKLTGLHFFTGSGKERIIEAFENLLVSEVQRIVNDTRTGSTI